MSLDTEVLSTLTGIDRVNAITSHIVSLPQDLRGSTVRTYLRDLPEPEAARVDVQLAPPRPRLPVPTTRRLGHLDDPRRPRLRKDSHWSRVGPRTGRRRCRAPHCPRRAHPRRSPVRHDRGRVRHRQHISTLGQAHLRAVQAKAHLAQRCARPSILKPRAGPAQRPSVRRRMVRRARLVGVPRTDLGQPHFRPQARTPATLRRHHNAQVHRACPQPPQQARRTSHPRIHLRESGQPAARLLQPAYRAVRRHTHRTAGDLRRAYRRGRRRHLETRVDREGTPLKPSPGCPHRRRHRPRHVHQAQQLRDRHRSRRCRHAPKARLRPRRRVRQAHPQLLGAPRRPPIRQVQRHPHRRRGQRRRRHGQIHPQERRRPHPALQGHQGPPRQVHPRRTRRRPLRAGPRPPQGDDLGRPLPGVKAPSSSKTRCVPGPQISVPPTPPTASTPSSTPSQS